jgi:hypothetical protein
MTQTLLFCIGMACISSLWAQQSPKTALPTQFKGQVGQGPSFKAVTDTLHADFLEDQITLYAAPNGGFLSGTSGYNEYAKVQEFKVDSAIGVSGFLFWFAYKAQNSLPEDSSRLILAWYDCDTAGTVVDSNRLFPNRLLAADTLSLSDVDTSSVFDGSVYLWEPQGDIAIRNFAAGIVLDLVHSSDTIALWSSTDGDPNRPRTAWEQYQGEWTPIYHNWGVDVGLSVLALVDRFAGLEASPKLSVRMGPNPAVDHVDLKLKQALKQPKVTLLDGQGRVVHSFDGLASGDAFRLDLSSMAKGTYILLIFEGSTPIHAGRLVKQ